MLASSSVSSINTLVSRALDLVVMKGKKKYLVHDWLLCIFNGSKIENVPNTLDVFVF